MASLQKVVNIDAFQFVLVDTEEHRRANPWMDAREAQEDMQETALGNEIPSLPIRKVQLLLAGAELGLGTRRLATAKLFVSIYGNTFDAADDFEMTPGQWLIQDSRSASKFSVIDDADVKAGKF